LHQGEEENEAHLPVASAQQGVVYSGGAMARWRGAVGFLLRFLQRRRNLDMKGRWRRERGRRGGKLGFVRD
jgi:hypothetical protein